MTIYIPRFLEVGDKTLSEVQLLQEGRVFVVLAEPGAGKTELLRTLAGLLQVAMVRASIFRHRPGLTGGPLVIDAMDEVARVDSAATDAIIARASDLSASASVIFAGRSSEWDERSTRFVEDCFGIKPVIVRLKPFGEAEQRRLFSQKFPGEDFDPFERAVQQFELLPLLGNPQFLELLGAAYLGSGRAFTSRAQIFRDAVARLAHEANPDLGRQKERPPVAQIAACAGEVFATLLLAGSVGIATVERVDDRDFPYLGSLSDDEPASRFLLDTRLVKPSDDTDTHEPIHKIVAEYAAANHLVARVEDPADRLSLGRLFSVVAPNGVARDELRGMLGWMAALGREPLQLTAIRLDPYAVLANGDPSQLTGLAKRELLIALEELAKRDPIFRRSDVWRRFNVGHFFTEDILDQVRVLLRGPGPLLQLMLELVAGTAAAPALMSDLVALVRDPAVGGERMAALEATLDAEAYDPILDFDVLISEQSPEALKLAARMVVRRGVARFGIPHVLALLDELGRLYQEPRSRRVGSDSRYFIAQLIASFGLADVVAFLDALAPQITCTCAPKQEYECTCRRGASKLVGRLLDRFFDLSEGPPDAARIWPWLQSLHFGNSVPTRDSASIRALAQDHALRRAVQQLVVQDVGDENIHGAITSLYHPYRHAGIRMHDGDPEALSEFAFDQGRLGLWTELFFGHSICSARKGPNPGRARQRQQSRASRAHLAAWSKLERSQRRQVMDARRAGYLRNSSRYAAREKATEEKNRAHLRANLPDIEAGRHWSWLKLFAHIYLHKPDKLGSIADNAETPLRALRNCFPFLAAHVPSLEQLGRGEGSAVAEVLFAACVVHFRDGDSLNAIDPRILTAVKAEARSTTGVTHTEEERFEQALDLVLFKADGSAERFLRAYVEPQLAAPGIMTAGLYWLDNKPLFRHLRPTLALEWLERFPGMPAHSARTLFGSAVRHGDRQKLHALICDRQNDPATESAQYADAVREQRTFWQLQAFLYHAPCHETAWKALKDDPQTVLALEQALGPFASVDGEPRLAIRAEDVFRIMDAFIEMWPKVPLPSSYGSGSPDSETAYRFLKDVVWKIGQDIPERRIPVLDRIIGDPKFSDYREAALSQRAEALRRIALQDFRAPPPADVRSLLHNRGPASVEDLRALMVEELGEVQNWLKGAETDPLNAFYDGGSRVDENTARNRIVDQLLGQMKARGIAVEIERHMAGGNRCDITASAVLDGVRLLLVTEVKGQWNPELFTAASAQLDERYAVHPDAAKQGVYLALWYGAGEKIAGRIEGSIRSPGALREQILREMSEELRNRVDVVVLDLSRGSAAPAPTKRAHKRRRQSAPGATGRGL